VVAEADTVQVTLKDGRSFEGKVETDRVTDVAVVIKSHPFANSETQKTRCQEWAIAIGNPLGLDNTVTIGIISAMDRSSAQVGVLISGLTLFRPMPQLTPVTLAVLLNAQGEVIGVNTAIRADAQGLGLLSIETAARSQSAFSKGREHPS